MVSANSSRYLAYFLLYIPYILSATLAADPRMSYLIAWTGSFYIFYITLTGKVRSLPDDLPILSQLMRPIFLTQIIFAGYMAVSSIFYFMDKNGMFYLTFDHPAEALDQFTITAKCQRLYCLGHAALAHGMLVFMDVNKKNSFTVAVQDRSNFILKLAIAFSALSGALIAVPELEQLRVRFLQLSVVSTVIALANAAGPQKRPANSLIAMSLFLVIFLNSVFSGMKEQLLIPIILLLVFFLPLYRKAVCLLAPVALFLFFYFIPSYNNIVREEAWFGEQTVEDASEYAIEQIGNGEVDISSNNWNFLTERLSEMAMFEKYVSHVPEKRDFYQFQIIKQSIEALIPRLFYPDKSITEDVAMERAFESGAYNENASGSGKPSSITDGYLSFGGIGAWLICFAIGSAASSIAATAERLFGGYLFGSGLVYTGLFQIFWRGNSMEFLVNTVLYSTVTMLLLFFVGKKLLILQKPA